VIHDDLWPDWVHEIKHDGYRLIVRRDGEALRLFTRRLPVSGQLALR